MRREPLSSHFDPRVSPAAGDLIRGSWPHAGAALDAIGDAVLCTDVAGRVTYLNRAAETMTGWSRASAVGRPLRDVFNAEGRRSSVDDSTTPIRDRHGLVVGAVIVISHASAALERSREALHLAQHDPLTQLPTRALLHSYLAKAIALCRRHEKPLAVGVLDVDGFKTVNDSRGHLVGDRVLAGIANRIKQTLRDADSVGRVGGDEFVIALSEIEHASDAALVGQKLLQAVAIPHAVGGREITITASLGLALYPDHGLTAEDLIANADAAMYTAKRSGQGLCRLFEATLTLCPPERSAVAAS